MIELYYREMTKDELTTVDGLIKNIIRLKNIHRKIPLDTTFHRYKLRADFMEKNKSHWRGIKNNYGLSDKFNTVLFNDSLALFITKDCIKIADLKLFETLYEGLSIENKWMCEGDLKCILGKINEALRGAYEKALQLYSHYSKGQRKGKSNKMRRSYAR